MRYLLTGLALSTLCYLATVIADLRQSVRGTEARLKTAAAELATAEDNLRLCVGTKRVMFALEKTQRMLDEVWR